MKTKSSMDRWIDEGLTAQSDQSYSTRSERSIASGVFSDTANAKAIITGGSTDSCQVSADNSAEHRVSSHVRTLSED